MEQQFLGRTKDDLSYLFKYSTHPGLRRENAAIFAAAIQFIVNNLFSVKSFIQPIPDLNPFQDFSN